MGRAPCCDKAKVKRGPWSPEEDAVLKTYMEETGSGGNWITLPQRAGLNRCGKSCRLRWLNYLRPEIKHGGFSTEEDGIICSLYRALGSRWSVIASRLPGRTDNDVKNYWNTKLKKRYAAQPQLGTQKALVTPITAPSAVSTPSNAPPCISPLLSTAPPFSYPYSTIDCSNSDDQVVPNPSPFPSRHPAFMSSSNEGGFFVTHSSVASTSYSPASGTPASSSTPSADCPEGSSIFADGNALLRSLVDTPTTTASSSLTMDYGSRGAGWFVQLPEADERSFVEAEAAFPSYYFNPLSPSSVNVAGWSIAGESYDGNSDACDSAGLLWDVVVDSASH